MSIFSSFDPVDKETWKQKVIKDLKGKAVESLNWEFEVGNSMEPFLIKEDIEDKRSFTSGRAVNSWFITESIVLPDGPTGPKKANKVLLEALMSGVNAPRMILDEKIEQKAFNRLFQGVHLDMIACHFDGAFTQVQPLYILRSLESLIKEKDSGKQTQNLYFHIDPLGYFMEEGEFYESETHDLDSLIPLIEYAQQHFPGSTMITVSGQYIHFQQDDVSRELAFMLAAASDYVARLSDRGLDPELIARQIGFSVSVGSRYFLEIAKIRALKLLWANVQKAYGIKEPKEAVVHAISSQKTQTEDTHINMVRATTEALSAVLGGVESLEVLPADSVHGEPDDFTRRMARNIQHLLKEESHLDLVVDPAEGSYYITGLTGKIADAAWTKFKKLEAQGGLLEFLKS